MGEKRKRQPGDYIQRRKALRRNAQRAHRRPAAWFGGVLYFTDRREASGRPKDKVPDAPNVPKPHAGKTGMEAAFPMPQERTGRSRRQQEDYGYRG